MEKSGGGTVTRAMAGRSTIVNRGGTHAVEGKQESREERVGGTEQLGGKPTRQNNKRCGRTPSLSNTVQIHQNMNGADVPGMRKDRLGGRGDIGMQKGGEKD